MECLHPPQPQFLQGISGAVKDMRAQVLAQHKARLQELASGGALARMRSMKGSAPWLQAIMDKVAKGRSGNW